MSGGISNMLKKKLYEIANVQAGGTPSRTKSEYWNGDIPWVKISNINSKFVTEYDETITDDGLKKHAQRKIQEQQHNTNLKICEDIISNQITIIFCSLQIVNNTELCIFCSLQIVNNTELYI